MSLFRKAVAFLDWMSCVSPASGVTEHAEANEKAAPAAALTPLPLLERPWAVLWLVAAMTPVFLLLTYIVPPFDDEFYYWCWSEELQFSYYDHPPMVAYMIRLSTMVFGHTIFAMRLPCIVSGLVVIGVVAWLSRPRDLVPYVILSPVPTFAAIMVTPDVPMLMFWALYMAWLVFIQRRLAETTPDEPSRIHNWHWLLGGILLGFGVLGKYTTGLVGISGFFVFVAGGQWRRWLAGYILHGLTAVAVAMPILIYNIQKDFAPLMFQWEHAMSSPEPGFFSFSEFAGIQLLLFGSLPFITFGWAFLRLRSLLAEPRIRVCTCLFLIPFGFFLYKSTQGRLEGNWAFPCYLACWPLAAELYRLVMHMRLLRILTPTCFVLPLGTSLVLLVHSFVPVPLMPVDTDRASRQWEKLQMAQTLASDLRSAGYHGPVYAPTYQWVSLLRWYGVDAHQHDTLSRPSHFTEREGVNIDHQHYVMLLETLTPLPETDFSNGRKYRIYRTHQIVVRHEAGPYFHLIDLSDSPVLPAVRTQTSAVKGGNPREK